MSDQELIRLYILEMKGVDIGGIAEPRNDIEWFMFKQAAFVASRWWHKKTMQ